MKAARKTAAAPEVPTPVAASAERAGRRVRPVAAEGNPSARIVIPGPAPGAGRPVGDVPATLAPATLPHDPDQLRFRILQRGTWRRAIKLEGIFWTALEDMAEQAGTKLTDYVQAFLGTRPEGANQTAELRTHATRWLHDRLTASEQKLTSFGPVGMLQAVPLPGFVIGRGLGLIGFNADFLHLIRRTAALEEAGGIPQARLNLDAPLAHIIDRLRETMPRPLECGFTLTIDRRASRGRVRVCIAPGPNGRDDIMGFVLTLKDDAT
jgi:predicted DNA-binding ribbon-helix-helix protein